MRENICKKSPIATCKKELIIIEAKYGEKIKKVNLYSIITFDDWGKWTTLFDAVGVKNFKGMRFL